MAGDVLLEKLFHCRISKIFVYWIEDFLRKWQVRVIVNGISMLMINLHYASFLPRLLFFLILYFFFNANLVESKINKNCEVVTFIDNYLVWVIRDFIKYNVNLL